MNGLSNININQHFKGDNLKHHLRITQLPSILFFNLPFLLRHKLFQSKISSCLKFLWVFVMVKIADDEHFDTQEKSWVLRCSDSKHLSSPIVQKCPSNKKSLF